MQVEHDVVLRNVPQLMRTALRDEIARQVAELERFSRHITSCRVLVEPAGRRHRVGNLFHVRIDLVLPGAEIVVCRDRPGDAAHVDPFVAVRDAFASARRRLEDRERVHSQAKTKVHLLPAHGRVTRLEPGKDYGFLEDSEGNEVYFHRHSVCGGAGFERLEVGQPVRFVLHAGVKGLQASSVTLTGRHHQLVG